MWLDVTLFWLGVGRCDIFLVECGSIQYFPGWIRVGVIFLWVGVGGCDSFLGGCGRV